MHASRIWERDRENEALVVLKKGSSAKLQCRAGDVCYILYILCL